jgi:hypothetical protein
MGLPIQILYKSTIHRRIIQDYEFIWRGYWARYEPRMGNMKVYINVWPGTLKRRDHVGERRR